MKLKKYLIPLLLFPCFLFSQSEVIEQNKSLIKQSFELYDKYFAEGKYKEAAQYAKNAGEAARSLGEIETQAIALNKGSKALMKIPGARASVLNRAFDALEKSNELTGSQSLKLENLELLLVLAKRMRKRKEATKLKAEITLMRGNNVVTNSEQKISSVLNRRKKTKEEYERMKNEKAEMAESLSELSEEQKLLREQQGKLVSLIEQKEKAIQKMNEEQMRQELLVVQQERLLDSMLIETIVDSLNLAQHERQIEQQQYELRKQEAEIELRNSHRNLLLSIIGGIIILMAGVFHRNYSIRKHNAVLSEKNTIIEKERAKSEELLLNILPGVIAEELKTKGMASTKNYQMASVMFVDFKGFSHIAKKLSAEKLVGELDHAFKNFDEIIGKYGLEKIKTIGDEYMCAGGLPTKSKNHPVQMVKAALEIQSFLNKWNAEKIKNKQPTFEARIGIHSGPLIAGVVGSKKFAYDVWGDTVNVASRMESTSEAGKVNISAATFEQVKSVFDCEYRGKVPAKNVGEVEMYYVKAQMN